MEFGAAIRDEGFSLLEKLFNTPKDWDSMELPPRPRYFLYNPEDTTFEFDEFRNSDSIPVGQRVQLSNEISWHCWKCREGDLYYIKGIDDQGPKDPTKGPCVHCMAPDSG